jgi:L-fuconolactonase
MKQLVIDAHQHYWEFGRFDYFWMTPEREALRRNFLPEDLAPLLRKSGVDRTIAVQAHASHEESFWLLELASSYEFVAGVVAWTDLTSPNLGKALDEFQRHRKFKGIRHPLEAEPDDGWVVRVEVLQGLAELERRGIPFDLVIFPRHLKYVPEIRERCPRLKLVIDHLAKPDIASRKFESWARELERVAKLPLVWCKLSGMVTEADHKNWRQEDFRLYVDHVVRHFGYDRVMFGSDWPICVLAASYDQVVYTLSSALGPLTEDESAKVWGRNASEFYALSDSQRG